MKDPCIIVALDVSSSTEALRLADKLDPDLCRLKVGKELFTAAGPQLIEQLMLKEF
jgi:orotidine-5'-phosphate decarboxylase